MIFDRICDKSIDTLSSLEVETADDFLEVHRFRREFFNVEEIVLEVVECRFARSGVFFLDRPLNQGMGESVSRC